MGTILLGIERRFKVIYGQQVKPRSTIQVAIESFAVL
jgi:hypothetical protein